jgi:hypothetical protein
MFTIRPFDYSEADYAALHAIDAAAYPEYKMSLADWRHLDATLDPEFLFCREMIERDGGVVAFGEYRQGPFARCISSTSCTSWPTGIRWLLSTGAWRTVRHTSRFCSRWGLRSCSASRCPS